MSRHQPPLIIVADDQLPTTLMLERVFEMGGYQVKSVYDGLSALDVVQQEKPDLVLLDVNMPKMNGFDVLSALRNDADTVNIPTILITAMGELGDVVQGLQLGADDYIRKPFHPQELLARAQSKMKARDLEDNLQRRTKELEALLRVSEELSQHLDTIELIDFIQFLMMDLVPCRSIMIYHLKNGEIVNQSQFHSDIPQPDVSKLPLPQTIKDIREPTIIDIPRHSTSSHPQALIIVPIIYNDVTKGISIIETSPEEYDENHLRVLTGISRQAALAIHNAELYENQANYAIQLEDKVLERTKELESANQMLIRSEKLASIGRLAASIAHEIKNPLMPIRLNLEGMLEDIENNNPVDRRDVEQSIQSAERIQHIIDNVLGFTGRKHSNEVEFHQININDVLEGLIELNHKALTLRNIKIVSNFSPIPGVLGNRYQIEQVFMNLILNARDAMGDNGCITISTEKENEYIVTKIQDTGPGITPEILDEIFEPFVSTKEDGNGLGLFISYGIIQNHQGNIQIESMPGQGTCFRVCLPIAK